MLWTIIVILVVLWLLGLIGHVGGSLIHLLLVVVIALLVRRLWCEGGDNFFKARVAAQRARAESEHGAFLGTKGKLEPA